MPNEPCPACLGKGVVEDKPENADTLRSAREWWKNYHDGKKPSAHPPHVTRPRESPRPTPPPEVV